METVRFDELDLCQEILRGVKEMGFEEASPIQAQAIPVAMQGYDVIGQAQTGTGKTAAFGIPVLEKVNLNKDIKHPQALILCPTRELAVQAAEEIRKLAKYMHGIKVLPIYGGQDINKQIRALKGTQVIIGTPGRVMDHLRRKTIRCDYVNTIVLDEADEMLNMGFREDIETVLEYIPTEDRQTILFSATMPKAILEITKNYQKPDAKMIKVVKKELTVPKIEQYYLDVKRKDKIEVLTRLLDFYEPKLSLVFCNTKKMVDDLTEVLKGRGYFAEGLHGDMSQAQRDRVMKSFRSGKTDILIATDVAARGIDVDDVEAVLYKAFNENEDCYSTFSMDSLLDTMNQMMSTMTYMLAGIASIALLVGGIGIMNMMLVSVSERTKEIGLRKAMGATPGRIQLQFLLEAIVLSLMGGIVGVILGLLISFAGAQLLNTNFTISMSAIGLGVGFSAAVGIIFGWAPARKASRLNPIDALRSE